MREALTLKQFFPTADALRGRRIVDAYALCDQESGLYGSVRLILDTGVCDFEADIDTDEILVSIRTEEEISLLRRDAAPLLDRERLSGLVGKEIGWSWSCYNSQGYRDAIMVAAPGVVPTVIFYVIASFICIGHLELEGQKRTSK